MVTTLVKFPAMGHKELRYYRRQQTRRFQRPDSNPRKCGICRRTEHVQIRKNGNSCWWYGLINCGQIWVCAVCAYRIAHQRAKELQVVIDGHRKAGLDVWLLTLTLPHDQGDDLKPMRKAVAKAWRKTTAGRTWLAMKKLIGLAGQVRALEVMHGRNGWHPHLHILLFCDVLSEAQGAALSDFLYRRWAGAIEAAGYRRPTREHGLSLTHGEAAGYYVTKITKQGLAQEIGSTDSKQGRNDSRSILQIIDDVSRDGLDDDESRASPDGRLINEWMTAMYRARQLTWSRGIRKRYLPPEQLDFDLVQDLDPPSGEAVVEIHGQIFSCVVRLDPSLSWRLLSAAETIGAPGVYTLLEAACAGCPGCPRIPP